MLVASLVLAISFAPSPGRGALALALCAVALVAGAGFVIRQRHARAPLYDLHVAARRIFWVAAAAGIVVFGTLMGAMFVGQQFLQNVLGYSTLDSGLAILPAALLMVLVAPQSAKLVQARGSRFTLQRDLGGAIMQSILGALLTAGYATAFGTLIAAAPKGSTISDSVRDELEKSFAGAQEVARQYPQYAGKITAAARSAFLSGDQWAYLAGIVAVLLGAIIVFFLFPGKRREQELLAGYESEDGHRAAVPSQQASDHQELGQRWLPVETSS